MNYTQCIWMIAYLQGTTEMSATLLQLNQVKEYLWILAQIIHVKTKPTALF
jgi:hypothetical protein